jgi:hypothetical protein
MTKPEMLINCWLTLTGQDPLESYTLAELGPYAVIELHFAMLKDDWVPSARLVVNDNLMKAAPILQSPPAMVQ